MNNSGLPLKITTAFASGDSSRSTIPENGTSGSTGTIATGAAAMDTGFPPLTRVPISSGGIPPHGEDMNGILYSITNKLQAYDAGAKYPFDSSFAAKIGGYANGAIVASSDLSGEWLNTVDANSANPEGTAATNTGWVPLAFTGASAVAISTADVTMTCLAAARPIIILSGALTSNRYLYVPAWSKDWIIINNCTGPYSVIVSTVGGTTTASIASGAISRVYCNGSSVTKLQGTSAAYDVGTSGASVPLLNGANTWSETNRFSGSLNLDRYFNVGYNNTTAGTRQIAFYCNGNTTQTSSIVADTSGNILINGSGILGIGQTWQDVTSIRSLGVTYTNNTGRPIYIFINFSDLGSTGYVLLNGVSTGTLDFGVVGKQQISFIIPNGNTYLVSTGSTISAWLELR